MSNCVHIKESLAVEIIAAIRSELVEESKPAPLKIDKMEKEGNVYKVFIKTEQYVFNRYALTKTLEGDTAWLAEPKKGVAEVLSVIPEASQINLRYATTPPPDKGVIFVYPDKYLQHLLKYWKNEQYSDRSLDYLDSINLGINTEAAISPLLISSDLRESQKRACQLFSHKTGFLWVPPGSGKTFTLGCMLAEFLIQRPSAKILLLSTSNLAVDLALVSVEDRLEMINTNEVHKTRAGLFRIGNYFSPANYKGKEHLLPESNENLLEELIKLEASKPNTENVIIYEVWKSNEESIRENLHQQTKEVLKQARLAAMTVTAATTLFDMLCSVEPFDLIVFDEASQVGKVQALALCTLGSFS